jgi:hypothetical protein
VVTNAGRLLSRNGLHAIIRSDEDLMHVLTHARSLIVPQWRLVAGCLYQTVWNHQTGRPRGMGIKDYDLIYFDERDLSWQAEDGAIKRTAQRFGALGPVEVRNQARVHLWFEQRFGVPYTPLRSAVEALTRYASLVNAVGVRLEDDGRLDIVAPFGLDDLFNMIIRHNTSLANAPSHEAKGQRAKAIWPEVTVLARDYDNAASSPGSA